MTSIICLSHLNSSIRASMFPFLMSIEPGTSRTLPLGYRGGGHINLIIVMLYL